MSKREVRIRCQGSGVAALDDLQPMQGDLKTLSTENYQKLRGLIEAQGFSFPMFVWRDADGRPCLLDGHQRTATLKKMREEGWDVPPLPVAEVQAATLKEAHEKLLAAASQFGRVDRQGLYEFIQTKDIDLSFLKANIDLPNFDLAVFDAEFFEEGGTEGETDPDAMPEVKETRCKPGDLWLLGKHRLLCGDSTNVQHLDRLMGGVKADMVLTDPPYGMDLDTRYAKSGQATTVHGKLTAKRKNYAPVIGDDEDFDASFLCGYFVDVSEMFLFGADYYYRSIPMDGQWSGSWFVWDKNCSEEADKMHTSAFELCWSKTKHKRQVLRIRSGIYGAKDDSKSRVHPTQKVVQVPQWFIENFSESGALVADPFLGSGSTLIACEKTGRRCFGMEIDPHYCSVILKRWEDFTGKTATLVPADG